MNLNEMHLFPKTQRRTRRHRHRSFNKPNKDYVTFASLLPFVNRQLGPHDICKKLYPVPLRVLNTLFEETKTSHYLNFATPEHMLSFILRDVARQIFKTTTCYGWCFLRTTSPFPQT